MKYLLPTILDIAVFKKNKQHLLVLFKIFAYYIFQIIVSANQIHLRL